MGCVTLTAALILLTLHGRDVGALTINSISTGNVLTGGNISLDISYIQSSFPVASWTINNVSVASWINGSSVPPPNSSSRLSLYGSGSLLIINSTKADNGIYVVTVNVLNELQASRTFQVTIYDPVVNVTVTQNPQSVDENTAVVNLTCRAMGDSQLVTWTRNGQILGYNDSYILQDGNKTLQIKYPNRTYTGNYTCNMSNAVSWSDATWELTVTYTNRPASLSGGAIAGIVIGSVLGFILLIILIVLLVCCIRKRKTGNEKKIAEPQHKDVLRTISGNTLSPDDPAYFTMNNIMYRNSSISMGSYIMNYDMSDYKGPSSKPSPSALRVKHATQV